MILLQTSCAHHDSGENHTKPAPPAATNTPVVVSVPAVTNAPVAANLPAQTTGKGIAGVDEVPVAKPATVYAAPYHRVFVLCVGVNRYPAYTNHDLRFAVSDAAAIADTFRQVYGFTNVTLLTDDLATRANVLAALADIGGRLSAQTNDDFIFYFSGHGATWPESKVQDGQTNITRHGFLMTYNETNSRPGELACFQQHNLEITDLTGKIIQLPARHRLMFLDSCFSGLAYVNQPVVTKEPDDVNPGVINHPTVEIMTAGLASEESVEDSGEAHGVFTAALLKQLDPDNVLAMEEVFFPLRVQVRKSLEKLQARRMSPQFRYLVYNDGTFLFVPLKQLPYWASETTDLGNPGGEDTKGFTAEDLRPVSPAEATNVISLAGSSPEEQQKLVDHYETRAAMGDPLATIALAQIYQHGVGSVPPDPDRARLYGLESHDLLDAGKTLNIAALIGITNEMVQAIVGNLVKGYNLNDFVKVGGVGLVDNQTTLVVAQQGINYMKPAFITAGHAVGNAATKTIGAIGGWFTHSNPMKTVVGEQKSVKKLLANPSAKNIISAKRELASYEEALAKLGALLSTNQPPELEQLSKIVHETELELDQNLTNQAASSIEDAQPVIDSLQEIIKNQPAKKRP